MAISGGFSKFPSEKTFNIDFTSEIDGEHYQGVFTVKRPTMVDQMRVESMKSELLGGRYYVPNQPGVGVSSFADDVAEGLAFLRVCLTNYPDWWNNGELYDVTLLVDIYQEARQVDPFRKATDEKGKEVNVGGGTGKDSSQQHNITKPNDLVKAMVDEEI